MNQLVEHFPKFSGFLSKCENLRTSALSVVSSYGEAAKTAVPYVILGCLCFCVWICVKCFKSKRMSVPTRSKTFRELYGGDLALKRLFDYYEDEPSPDTFHRTDSVMKDLLDDEHLDLKKLQSTVAKVEKSGTEAEASAVEQLKAAEKAHSENPHEAYEIGMLLVELLIYEGKYKEALKHECLTHEEISDARRPLYKTITHIMLGNYEEAEKYWEEFNEIRELFHHKRPSSSSSSLGEAMDNTITDFQKFRSKVEKLKAAMHEIGAKKKAPK